VINLRDIDLKKPENRFTEVIELPHGLGSKARKVAVIASGAEQGRGFMVNLDVRCRRERRLHSGATLSGTFNDA
jgi:ribosomal protein L1